MKKAFIFSFASLLLAASMAFGVPGEKASPHGHAMKGTVSSVDMAAKTFVLKAGGKDTTVSWSDATAVTGGQLKDGETVEVRSVDRNGAHMATAIKIEPAKPAKAATK